MNSPETTRVDNLTDNKFGEAVAEFWRDRRLALSFAKRDIRLKYVRTRLGLVWLIANPIITVGVFTFVFGAIVKIPTQGLPYLAFYLVAIVTWNFFANLVNINAAAIESYFSLLAKVRFSILAIPTGNLLVLAIDFLVGLVLAIVVSLLYGLNTIGLLLFAPASILLVASFGTGLGIMLANLGHKYRDIRMAIPLAMQLFFFANPILYPASILDPFLMTITSLNPLQLAIELLRAGLLGQTIPLERAIGAVVIALAVLVFGLHSFVTSTRKSLDVV